MSVAWVACQAPVVIRIARVVSQFYSLQELAQFGLLIPCHMQTSLLEEVEGQQR